MLTKAYARSVSLLAQPNTTPYMCKSKPECLLELDGISVTLNASNDAADAWSFHARHSATNDGLSRGTYLIQGPCHCSKSISRPKLRSHHVEGFR